MLWPIRETGGPDGTRCREPEPCHRRGWYNERGQNDDEECHTGSRMRNALRFVPSPGEAMGCLAQDEGE